MQPTATILIPLLLIGLGCGGSGRRNGRTASDGATDAAPDAPVEDGARRCTSDGDCDDALDCTLDRCAVGGVCRNEPLDELCPDGERCRPGLGPMPSGCVGEGACVSDEECDDGIPCTVDGCGAGGLCRHDPIDARCGSAEVCDPSRGCWTPMACMGDEECDDGDFCNGAERCSPEFGCQPAPAPPSCDDGDPCTVDSCSTEMGRCLFVCDTSNPTCDCPVETPCSGTFRLSPVPSGSCALGMVNYMVSQVTFSCVGPVLSVDGERIPNASMNTPMTQTPRPTDDTFDVEARIEGGCTESYRLQGRFTGPDTFEATFTATYTDTDGISCTLGGCANQRLEVTGTRSP